MFAQQTASSDSVIHLLIRLREKWLGSRFHGNTRLGHNGSVTVSNNVDTSHSLGYTEATNPGDKIFSQNDFMVTEPVRSVKSRKDY